MPAFDFSTSSDGILEQHLLAALTSHDPALPHQEAEHIAATLLQNTNSAAALAASLRGRFDLPAFGIEEGTFTLIANTVAQRRAEEEFRALITAHLFHHIPALHVPAATQALKDTDLWHKTWISVYQIATSAQHQAAHPPETIAAAQQHAKMALHRAHDTLADAARIISPTADAPLPTQAAATYLYDLTGTISGMSTADRAAKVEYQARELATQVRTFRQSLDTGSWGTLLLPVLPAQDKASAIDRLDSAAATLDAATQPFTTQRLDDHITVFAATRRAISSVERLEAQLTPHDPAGRNISTVHMALLTALDARSYDYAAQSLEKAITVGGAVAAHLATKQAADAEAQAAAKETKHQMAEAAAAARRLADYHHDQQLLHLIGHQNHLATVSQGRRTATQQTLEHQIHHSDIQEEKGQVVNASYGMQLDPYE